MFKWLKNTSKKVDDTLDKAKTELTETSDKIQKVLDEGGDSVKVAVKGLIVVFGVSILTNTLNIILALSKHKTTKTPTITIQNLYLGDKK